MDSVEVIDNPHAAAVALDPMRSRLLAALSEPRSAASLAAELGLPRQKANYHLRTLEAHGLVRPAGERTWGGLTERLVTASAEGYLISPQAMGEAGADPERTRDRLSASYLIALAGRAVREVGALLKQATQSGKRLATLSLDAEIRFRTPQDRAAFADELTKAVLALAAKYHEPDAATGRSHRLAVFAYPEP